MNFVPLVGVRVSADHLFSLLPKESVGEVKEAPPADFFIVTDSETNAENSGPADLRSVMVAVRGCSHYPSAGFIAESDLGTAEPYNVAREIGTLDIMTGGKAGLLLRQTSRSWDVRSLAIPYRENAALLGFQNEALEVIKALWKSWDPDAIIRDWNTARFLDADRVKTIDYEGQFLKIKGPSGNPPSPQFVMPTFWTDRNAGVPAAADFVLQESRVETEARGTGNSCSQPVIPIVRDATEFSHLEAASVIVVDSTGEEMSMQRLREHIDRVVPGAFSHRTPGIEGTFLNRALEIAFEEGS